MKTLYRKIHRNFKLNGISYSREELKEVAYSLIKEGEAFEKEIGVLLLDWTDDTPTLEVRTSGSTGKAKIITLQKHYMVNSARATGEFFGLQPGNSALLCLPATYIAGKMMLVRAMVLGLELDYVCPSSNPMTEVSKSYDFGAMVPLQLENSLNSLDQFKMMIVGGAPLSNTAQAQVQAHIQKTQVYETYGMTETITHIALKRIDQSGVEKQLFRTLPNVNVSTDARGCLIIDAPKITDAPVVTNDVVDLVSATEFEWLGRYDNVINSGGVKLFPEQIETKLASLMPSRFFVVGLPDEKLGQKLVLVVEGAIQEEKLLQKIRSLNTLEKFEVPKQIYQVTEFQQTESGKIRRNATLDLAMG